MDSLGSIWIAWVQCFLSSWLLFIVLVSRGGVNTQYCYLIAPGVGRKIIPLMGVINKAFIEAHWVMERISLYGLEMIDGPSLQN